MKELTLTSSDRFPLSVKIFEPEKSNNKLLVVNSATGVKQQVYFAFAKFLSEKGFTVITYDYRGIGESKPKKMSGFSATMRSWGTEDFKAVTTYVKNKYDSHQKFCMGHSVGALIIGMNEDAQIFEKFIFIATQDAYIGNLKPKIAALGLVGFGLALPMLTTVLGYFPAHRFGLGESLPKGVAFDWQTLILNKKSTSRLYEKIENDFSKSIQQKTLILHAEDDPWVTDKGMTNLMTNLYPNLDRKFREIKIEESAKREIGHINFFRSFNKSLWEIISEEIL